MGASKKICLSLLVIGCIISICWLINNKTDIDLLELSNLQTNEHINDYKYGIKNVNTLDNFISCRVKKNTVIIFEGNNHHQECIPGFAKYFIDLGYNVDILVMKGYENALFTFYPDEKVRLFIFDDEKQVKSNSRLLRIKFKMYDYIFINSGEPGKIGLLTDLGALYSKNTLLVAHDVSWVTQMGQYLYDEGRVVTIGNFLKGIQVVPQYFGEIPIRDKNTKTRFFITSTMNRQYNYLFEAIKTLDKEGLEFDIVAVGYSDSLPKALDGQPEEIKKHIELKYHLPFDEMYKVIEEVDYIIITLDPRNRDVQKFRDNRATGSTQVSYGFLKPSIIHEEFAPKYYLTEDDSFIYNQNNFTDVLRKAIKLTKEEYKNKQFNLEILTEYIYSFSIENLKSLLNQEFSY